MISHLRPLYFFYFNLIWLFFGCASNPEIGPGQLATRAIEIRYLETDYETGFRASTHALFTLGYTIKHSDKASGILVGANQKKNTGAKIGWMLLFGVAGSLIETDVSQEITLFLEKGSKDQRTTLRIQMLVDGEPKIEPLIVDSIWVIAQREAMLVKGITVPQEIEDKYNELKEGKKKEIEPKNSETPEY